MVLLRSFVLAGLALVVGCSSATTSPTPSGSPSSSSTSPTAPPDDTTPPGETPKLAAYTEREVQQLFDARCVRCHDSQSANLDLSEPFAATTVNVRTGGAAGKTVCANVTDYVMRIKPGDREASLLWHKVKGTQDCGKPMPYDKESQKLDADELERLGLYIDGLAKK